MPGACSVIASKVYHADTAMMSSAWVRMYVVKAADFQWPSVWINESLNPAREAVDAAPILKLWPEKFAVLKPAVDNAA